MQYKTVSCMMYKNISKELAVLFLCNSMFRSQNSYWASQHFLDPNHLIIDCFHLYLILFKLFCVTFSLQVVVCLFIHCQAVYWFFFARFIDVVFSCLNLPATVSPFAARSCFWITFWIIQYWNCLIKFTCSYICPQSHFMTGRNSVIQ